MYYHVLNAFYKYRRSEEVLPNGELKLLGLLPLTLEEAVAFHQRVAPAVPFSGFYLQEAGERDPFTEAALKAGFAARWDGFGRDPFSALFLALSEYAEHHTSGSVKKAFNANELTDFNKMILITLGAGRALGIHQERARRRNNKLDKVHKVY